MPVRENAEENSRNLRRQPPTEKQLSLMREMGLNFPPDCTISLASSLISQAQISQHYALQVARQEWGKDLSGVNLRPVIHAVIAVPEIVGDIQEIMDANAQAAWTAKDEQKQDAKLEVMPDLREDENYRFVKTKLEEFFPQLKTIRRTALPPPSDSNTKVFLARESGMMDKIKDWVDDLLH